MARRFDLLLLNLQLAILESSPRQERFQRQVMTLMGNLEEKQAIPSVAKQMELIQELQRDEYWQNVTLPMLESARKKLRDLIKFVVCRQPRLQNHAVGINLARHFTLRMEDALFIGLRRCRHYEQRGK